MSRGILPPEPGWVNSVAINYYHDGSEGIQLHYDDAQRFVRPIYRWDACSRFPRVLEALTYHRVWHSVCVLVCRSLAACHDTSIYTYMDRRANATTYVCLAENRLLRVAMKHTVSYGSVKLAPPCIALCASPSCSLRLYSDSRLSFGGALYGYTNNAFFVPMPRG